MLLWEVRPNTIIEVRSNQGGTAAWLADTMRTYRFRCQIHSIDINPVTWLQLPDVTFHKGDANLLELSFSPDSMRSLARPLLVIEDSLHEMTTSLAVLNFFHNWLVAGDDANAPSYGTTLSGGGATVAVALCDGTNWTAH